MPRSIPAFVSLLVLLLAAVAPARADELPLPWDAVDAAERRALDALLQSPHWTFRAVALLRLERYAGPDADALVVRAVDDDAWAARCFAVRAVRRRGAALPETLLAREQDPRVVRTILRCGTPLPEARIGRAARRLMSSRAGLDEPTMGVEIAAASDVEALRREALARTKLFLASMDETGCARLAARLERIVDRTGPNPPPGPLDTVTDWHGWIRANGGALALAPALSGALLDAPRSRVAELDGEEFLRLVDYLAVLRQRRLELALVVDATNSMAPLVDQARAGIESLVVFHRDLARSFRLAVVAYRDHDNPPIVETLPFTEDVDRARRFLFDLGITGGRDFPEAVLEGLEACRELEWSNDARRRVVLVGDAEPHQRDEDKVAKLLREAAARGVAFDAFYLPTRNPLVASAPGPVGETPAERAFAHMAQIAGGRMQRIERARDFVPMLLRLEVDDAWWSVIAEFVELYEVLCRG